MANIYIASDHAGFVLKEVLVGHLVALGHVVQDLGPTALTPDDDYPDYVTPCAKRVAAERDSFGIVIGGSGQGEAMAANRVSGARAAVYYGGPLTIVSLAREHNNANILSLAARYVGEEEAKRATDAFIATAFSGDARHIRRLAKF